MGREISIKKRLPWYFWLGLLSFFVVLTMLVVKIEPVVTYFYVFIWWSWIISIDGLIFWRRGYSLISKLGLKFLILIFCSAFFWVFFEILNLRIGNWSYSGPALFPVSLIIFGLLAFGSVLPGILEIHDFLILVALGRRLEFLGWERTNQLLYWKWWGRPSYLWVGLGIVMIILSLLQPFYFFWLIWIAVIFILDPFVEKGGGQSILAELRAGRVRNFYRLLLTGLICGILWEAWNFWAGLKWVYHVPFVNNWKIFEMPVLGYLGFMTFAVECYVFYQFLCCQWLRLKKLFKRVSWGS